MSGVNPPVIAVRGSTGVLLNQGPPGYEIISSFPKVSSKSCKAMVFSPEGQYFAWVDGLKIVVVCTRTWKVMFEVEKQRALSLMFSPKGTYLASWELFIVSKECPNGQPNLRIWKTENGSLVQEFIHKQQINWQLQWSKDEKLCARLNNGEVLIYEKNDFSNPVHKIHKTKVDNFSLSPSISNYHFLCYMPGDKGPSAGRLFKYPIFDDANCVANKSSFKADKVDIFWNSKGNHVLMLTSTDVDKTGSSYYGNQLLHSLSIKGDTANVPLNKDGPIHDIGWNPNGEEFCVVYGYMPSKAALFNQKCEVIFDFGIAHRNCLYFNPHGNLLVLGGFGNISGRIEVWDAVNRRRISNFSIPDTTHLEWSPDGFHILTATTAPRLRVGNGFKIWHYSSALLYERPWNKQEELWEVCWQKFPENAFKKPSISFKHVEGIQPTQPTASKEAYRPPGARGKPVTAKFTIHDEETNESRTHLSKASLKMKKKRENKRQAKQQEERQKQKVMPENASSAVNNAVKNGLISGGEILNNNDDKSTASTTKQNAHISNNENSNKIKKIKMNLKSIEKLKDLQASGKELDKNQLEKINKEPELIKELKQLTL